MTETPTRFVFYPGNPLFTKSAEVISTLGERTYLVQMTSSVRDSKIPPVTHISVLKVASKEDRKASLRLQHEHDIYRALKAVQGIIVPDIYGLLEGIYEGTEERQCHALEIEYCLEGDEFVQTPDFKRKTIEALRWLHAAGFAYSGSLDQSHLVADGHSPRLISLSRIHSGHICPHFIRNGPDGMPLKSVGCCSELVATCAGVDHDG